MVDIYIYIWACGRTSEGNLFVENLVAVLTTPPPRPLMKLYCFDTRS